MIFQLELISKDTGYVCHVPTTEAGARDVGRIRCESEKEVPLEKIDGWKRGIYVERVVIDVPEKIALGLPEFQDRCTVRARVPGRYLNDCVEEAVHCNIDDETGECEGASIHWEIDRMDALLKWLGDDENGIGAYRREQTEKVTGNDS